MARDVCIGLQVKSLPPTAHFKTNSNSHIIVVYGNIYFQVDDHIHNKHTTLTYVIDTCRYGRLLYRV